jgi:aminoglycoside phosphotransferase (APT) family kinase protein
VLRVERDAGEAYAVKVRREATVQRFVAGAGYPALEPLATEDAATPLGLPFMVLPRVMGPTMFERVVTRPWQARALLRQMAALHARLHRLPLDGCPLRYERPSIEAHLADMRRRVWAGETADLEQPLAWVESSAGRVLPEEQAFTHNDFHPLNVLLDPKEGPVVIDWEGAAIGDRHADVARTLTLLWVAAIAASNVAERMLLRLARGYLRASYLGEYERLFPLDKRRLAYWEAFAAFGGMLQLAGQRSARGDGARTEFEQRVPPQLFEDVRGYFWRRARMAEAFRE